MRYTFDVDRIAPLADSHEAAAGNRRLFPFRISAFRDSARGRACLAVAPLALRTGIKRYQTNPYLYGTHLISMYGVAVCTLRDRRHDPAHRPRASQESTLRRVAARETRVPTRETKRRRIIENFHMRTQSRITNLHVTVLVSLARHALRASVCRL